MASTSTNTQNASSAQHFETLLSKRQLQRGMTFKPVAIHVIEFGEDGLNTENFINKIQELSATNTVKHSGGFIHIRPKKGVEQFTKPMNTTNTMNTEDNKDVWNALPSLNKDKHRTEILYERQRSGNWSFPLFTWNKQHKDTLKKHYQSKANHSKLLFEEKTTGQKRKNHDIMDSVQPRKRQRLDSSNINTNTSINPNDLDFYRGFCCMTKKYERYFKANVKDYIDGLQIYNTQTQSPYNEHQKIEDKWLIFVKYFYDENTVNYGHIEQDISCYDVFSPFKCSDLNKYGPFSCLMEEEYAKGIQIPYVYIGDAHTFFPWHSEDMNFHAVNHLLYGGDKIWFCIAASDYSKVMQYYSKQFRGYYTDCLTPLQHKNCLIDPYIFLCLGINVYYIHQKAGDIVITPSGALHCGFNESFNICESVNFMTLDDNQWILSLSAMLLKTYNYHDCCATEEVTSTPCVCCNKECINPDYRFQCKCKFCDPFKCPCDYNVFFDINELAQRVRNKFGIDIGIPAYDIKKIWDAKYKYKIYHPRKMSEEELDHRWISPPKCKREYIYPTQDRKDLKFYPAICYNNRIIKRNQLLLKYQYQMDFIAFGEYYQICDESAVVYPGGLSAFVWNNPPIGKQHGFYKNTKQRRNNSNHKHKSLLQKQLKGTPSFDFLKIEYNVESPLIGTEWEHKKVIYAYPPGARKYNLEIRKKKVQNRMEQEKRYHYVDMHQDNHPDIVTYQIEEYNTDCSSSSFQVSNDNDDDDDDEDDGDAWTPDTNKWMGTLPEYQYRGLRAKGYSTRSNHNINEKDDSEDEYIMRKDYKIKSKKKKKKSKRKHSKKKKKKEKERKSAKKRKHKKKKKKKDKDKKKSKSRTKSKTIPKKKILDKRKNEMISLSNINNMLPVIPDFNAQNIIKYNNNNNNNIGPHPPSVVNQRHNNQIFMISRSQNK